MTTHNITTAVMPQSNAWFTTSFEGDFSGNESITSSSSYNNTTIADKYDEYNCNVWSMPSRIALQILILATLFFNIAASVVVFGVPVQVRGRHVSFLFSCVRVLNILDIWQCTILFIFPIFMPHDCSPSTAACDITGYLFTTATLFSPLVAIVMAVDRAAAVYFHVQYKAKPRTKIKYISLISLLGFYGVYLLLPCFTRFGAYVAVPWLSLCSFEWGVTSRTFDLILASTTFFLMVVLIAANVAILLKMRMQRKQIKRMKRSGLKNKKNTKEVKETEINQNVQRKKLHKSADDIVDIPPASNGTSVVTTSRLSKRVGKQVPPPLQLKALTNDSFKKPKGSSEESELFAPHRNSSPKLSTPPSYIPSIRINTRLQNLRPKSLIYPSTSASFSPQTPPFELNCPTTQPPSPLILFSDDGTQNKSFHKQIKSRSLHRSSSADNILVGHPSKFQITKQPTPTLLRRVLDYPTGKTTEMDNQSSNYTGSSDETDTPTRKNTNSSTSSYFSFSFAPPRGTSFPRKAKRKSRRYRKNVSKITKMTTMICMVFIILYFPFLIRKMVQLIPSDYKTVHIPVGVEIGTLFGPLLSPLFNPIIYVFLNPHYKRHCVKLLRKLKRKCWKIPCFRKTNTTRKGKVIKEKKKNITTTQGVISPTEHEAKFYYSSDDVFLPNNCAKPSGKKKCLTTQKDKITKT